MILLITTNDYVTGLFCLYFLIIIIGIIGSIKRSNIILNQLKDKDENLYQNHFKDN